MVNEESAWLAVIARSVAHIALHSAELGGADITSKAEFLEGLGLPRADVAEMLGTTVASITELIRRKRKKKGTRHAKAGK